jgi:hypothetical protein
VKWCSMRHMKALHGGHNTGKEIVKKSVVLDYGGHHYLKNLRIIVSVVTFSNRLGSHQGEMNYHSFQSPR